METPAEKSNYPLIIIVLLSIIVAAFVYPTLLYAEWTPLDAALGALIAGLSLFVVMSVLFWLARGVWRLLSAKGLQSSPIMGQGVQTPTRQKQANTPLIIIVLLAVASAGQMSIAYLHKGYSPFDALHMGVLGGLAGFVILSVLFWLVRGVWRLLRTNRSRPLLARVYDVNVPTPKKENHTTALIICTLLAIVALPSAYYNFIGIGYDSIDSLLLALMTVSIRFVVFFIIVYPILRAIWRVVRRQ